MLGDFRSGELFITGGPEGGEALDARRGVLFDGAQWHGTMPFEGERWSVVYFRQTARPRVPMADQDRNAYHNDLGFPLPGECYPAPPGAYMGQESAQARFNELCLTRAM